MYKAFDGDYIPEKVGYLESLLLEILGDFYSESDEICVTLQEGSASYLELGKNDIYIEDHHEDDDKMEWNETITVTDEQITKVREAFRYSGTIYLTWEAETGTDNVIPFPGRE